MAAMNRERKITSVKGNLLLAFVNVLHTDSFEVPISLNSFNILTSYKWVMEGEIPETGRKIATYDRED